MSRKALEKDEPETHNFLTKSMGIVLQAVLSENHLERIHNHNSETFLFREYSYLKLDYFYRLRRRNSKVNTAPKTAGGKGHARNTPAAGFGKPF